MRELMNPLIALIKIIGINMDKKMASELESRAEFMRISKSKYCRIVLGEEADAGREVRARIAPMPIGKNTKTIGVNIGEKMVAEIDQLADSMDISKSKYCKSVFQQRIASGTKLTLGEK